MRSTLISAIAILFSALSATAHAKLVDVTITGHIVDGFDRVGDFGPPNSSLGGAPFTAFVEFNTDIGNRQTYVFGDYLSGGQGLNSPTPVVDAYFEVNGVRFSIPGTYLGWISAGNGDYTIMSEYPFANSADMYFEIFAYSPMITAVIDRSFSGNVYDPNLSSSACHNNSDWSRDWCALSLAPTSMTIQPGGVPEPSTWAMLMLGVGGLGAAMRAARRTARIAFTA